MKMTLFFFSVCAALLASGESLEERFARPPESARLQAWWHWCGDNVSERGIAADLAAMQELDVGVAHVFLPSMMGAVPGVHAKLLTPEWKRLFAFAVAEAKKRGIALGFHNCPGWSSSGGPWIRPEDSMKIVVASAVDVTDPSRAFTVPQPEARRDFYRDIATVAVPCQPEPALAELTGGFAADALSAFAAGNGKLTLPFEKKPLVTAELVYSYATPFSPRALALRFGSPRVFVKGTVEVSDGDGWRKCGEFRFEDANDLGDVRYVALENAADARRFRLRIRTDKVPDWIGGKPFDTDLRSVAFTSLPMVGGVSERNSSQSRYGYLPAGRPETPGIPKDAFVDLTGKTGPDGSVAGGTLPAGSWRVLRIGYTTTGRECGPATLPGLECDKLSKRGLDAHWPHLPHELLSTPGAAGTVRVGIIDSFEVGGQNWTESMPEEFRRRRGYELRPYLPALVGYTVGTDGETAKFLFDFQRTVADLIAENYYDYFGELCHRAGIESATEAYGGPFDPLRCFRSADIPTGEFWLGSNPQGTPRLASSAAHVNGRSRIAAEAFTTEAMQGRWQITPHELRVSGDRGWLEGISQLVFHSYVSQPLENVKPGLSLGRHGTQLNRNTTWWKEGAGWSQYVRRGQFLLQAGESVSEALVLTGDGRPCFYERPWQFVQAGYQFDFIGRDDLLRLEPVPEGVKTPGGAVYPILSLGSDSHLTLATLRKVKTLLDAGTRIAGKRPADTPSLADDPAEWKALADEIWNGKRANLVEDNWDPLVAARRFGIPPPLDSKERLGSRRRRIEGRDFFFVLNDRDEPFADEVTFAADGEPSVWDAKSGAVSPLPFRASAPGRVTTRLSLPPHGSVFIGFGPSPSAADAHGDATSRSRPLDDPQAAASVVTELSEGWTITAFDGPCAPRAPLALARLVDWSTSEDPRLRYFAGHATYERTVDIPSGQGPLTLDLGEVRDIASVSLDGRPLACLWEPPYRVQLPEGTSGRVKLSVTVVNTWPNRLIGDAIARKQGAHEDWRDGYPAWVLDDKPDSGTGIYTWSNFDWGWTANDKPLPAGLIGPVRLN